MLYFRYKKFIRIFKTVQKMNNLEHLEWRLEEKYGKDSKEAVSILRANGCLTEYGLFHEGKNEAKLDSLILEYEDKCSGMFWECVKWTIGMLVAIAGLYIAYLSFVKQS